MATPDSVQMFRYLQTSLKEKELGEYQELIGAIDPEDDEDFDIEEHYLGIKYPKPDVCEIPVDENILISEQIEGKSIVGSVSSSGSRTQ